MLSQVSGPKSANERMETEMSDTDRSHLLRSEQSPTAKSATREGSSRAKITAEHLEFYYGDQQALYDISLEVDRNEVFALIGPSGCGKSTFLRTLNRMNDTIPGTRLTGSVKLDDQDIYASVDDVATLRMRVGMIFQSSNPFPKSISENVAYGLRVNGIKDKHLIAEVVEDALKSAFLWDEVKDKLDHSALALSGGQQQRLCIARALAIRPEVVLMDEPASALDPLSTAKIEDLIGVLKKDYTIVIVTHNMQQAARVSDTTAFFFEGRLIECGPTKGLFTKPAKKKTEDYITGRFG